MATNTGPKLSSPKSGKSGGHPGHGGGGRGKTVDWLAPLSRATIVRHARNTINKAYKPSYGDLDRQSSQAQAISDKRSADNKYYQSWLSSQMTALQAHADAAHQSLAGLEGQLNDQQHQLYQTQAGNLTTAANQRAGNVSNNEQSNAFGTDLSQNQQANMGLLNSAETQANSAAEAGNSQLAGAAANNTNVIQAAESKRQADLNNALTTIGNTRAKLQASQASDIAKEIARLQGIEIQKSQSNRDFAAASTKLGLQVAETKSLITDRKNRYNLALTNSQLAQMNSDRNFNLAKAKYGAATAKDLYERQHGLGPYKKSGGKTPLSPRSEAAIYSKIDKLRGDLSRLQHDGIPAKDAWHILHSGGSIPDPASPLDSHGNHTRQISFTAAGDDQLLNAAYNAVFSGGLSPGDIAALKHLGLAHPGKRYGTHKASTPLGGTSAGGTSPHHGQGL